MILRVIQYDEAVLRQPGIPVDCFDEDLRQLADNMLETMYNEEGIGLAAQQVGRIVRMFVMDVSPANPDTSVVCLLDGRTLPVEVIMPMVLVNPKMEKLGEEITWEEGCLSLPEIRGHVTRPSQVRVSFQDLDGHAHELECEGLLARCIQHEQDHLNGVLFIDSKRMSETERKSLEPEIKALLEKTLKTLGNSR